jgi:hypothetical protein
MSYTTGPAEPPAERCETCRFWRRCDEGVVIEKYDHVTDDGDGAVFVGECHRNPPAVCGPLAERTLSAPLYRGAQFVSYPVGVARSATVWPVVDRDEWCGEYRPKEPQ